MPDATIQVRCTIDEEEFADLAAHVSRAGNGQPPILWLLSWQETSDKHCWGHEAFFSREAAIAAASRLSRSLWEAQAPEGRSHPEPWEPMRFPAPTAHGRSVGFGADGLHYVIERLVVR